MAGNTLSPAYNEIGYNEDMATASRSLFIKIFDYNVEKFGYSEDSLVMSWFFCVFPFVTSGTHCNVSYRCFYTTIRVQNNISGEKLFNQ